MSGRAQDRIAAIGSSVVQHLFSQRPVQPGRAVPQASIAERHCQGALVRRVYRTHMKLKAFVTADEVIDRQESVPLSNC